MISYTYNGTEPVKVDDLLKDVCGDQLQQNWNFNTNTFLNFPTKEYQSFIEGTNSQWILQGQRTKKEKSEKVSGSSKIYPGVTIYFPDEVVKIPESYIKINNSFLSQVDYKTWWSSIQKSWIEDTSFNLDGNDYYSGISTQISSVPFMIMNPNVTVWVYMRALDKILNLTNYIEFCSTSKNMQEGHFTFGVVSNKEISDDIKNTLSEKFGINYYGQKPLTSNKGVTYFDIIDKYLQVNDLVFIRYENLLKKDYKDESLNNYQNKDEIPFNALNKNRYWDMIGLVDSNATTIDHQSTNKITNIFGRDLGKLFTDDGSYYIFYRFMSGGKDHWLYGGETNNGLYKRMVIDGTFTEYLYPKPLAIAEAFAFALSQLSNISLFPNNLFSALADLRAKKYVLQNKKIVKSNTEIANGVWQLIDLQYDPQLDKRILVDPSLGNVEGSMDDYFKRIAQQPFVEYFGDTYGSKFNLFVRQPPLTKQDVKNVLEQKLYVHIDNSSVLSTTLAFDNRNYNWFELSPQDSIIGEEKLLSKVLCPVIWIPELAEIYGCQRLIVPDGYAPFKKNKNDKDDLGFLNFKSGYINDLLYIIETHIHLPFTRRGTITITGDRRIKIGSYIYFAPTSELFYVIGVEQSITQSGSIDRTTTITVERGMNVNLWDGQKNTVNESGQNGMGYFDIINLEQIRKDLASNKFTNDSEKTIAPYFVNKDTLKFFISREFMKYFEPNTLNSFF